MKINRAELMQKSGWERSEATGNWTRTSTGQELIQKDGGGSWLLITYTTRRDGKCVKEEKRMGRDLGAVISQPGILTPDCAELLAQTVRPTW